jgi:glycine oxidase
MQSFEVAIAGAGLIGMACAHELRSRGLTVVVFERGSAAREASWAAGGMLAVRDIANPPELSPLSELSAHLYPGVREQIFEHSGIEVPFETDWTLEQAPNDFTRQSTLTTLYGEGFHLMAEHSLDPRKLTAALLAAVRAAGVAIHEHCGVQSTEDTSAGVTVTTSQDVLECGSFLDCTGAWSRAPIRPAKGQMLRVHAPGALRNSELGNVVVRTEGIYLIPRLDGSVVIGATVEDAGYDRTVHASALEQLQTAAAELVPALAKAPHAESWSGLRPDTPDHLPLLGRTGDHSFVAAGHFRNGVLLAPATARVMTQLMLGELPDADLSNFSPARFSASLA